MERKEPVCKEWGHPRNAKISKIENRMESGKIVSRSQQRQNYRQNYKLRQRYDVQAGRAREKIKVERCSDD